MHIAKSDRPNITGQHGALLFFYWEYSIWVKRTLVFSLNDSHMKARRRGTSYLKHSVFYRTLSLKKTLQCWATMWLLRRYKWLNNFEINKTV